MALTPVPNPGQTLANSRPDIFNNFATIGTAFIVDHVDYNEANQGKHNHVTMPRQVASPATTATEVALFSRLSTLSSATELAVRKESNGSVFEFTSCGAAAIGWTRLPSGILLKWGSSTTPPTGSLTYTFPVNPNTPAFTQIFSVQITTFYAQPADIPANGFVRLVSYIPASFVVYGSPRVTTGPLDVSFQYLAIGI